MKTIYEYKYIILNCLYSGDTNVIHLLDMFGFECFHQNNLDQLFINCLNEQLQYHYNQRMFAWEMVTTKAHNIIILYATCKIFNFIHISVIDAIINNKL